MGRFKEEMLGGREFIVTCEFVPGRGYKGRSVEEVIGFGKKVVSSDLPIHAVSITDNPGGNPAITPDVLAKELHAMGLEALVHFTSTDSNRNMIESRAYALARVGIENLLVVSGDYPTSGYKGMAKPIFDMDSVQVIHYLEDMNEGLEIPGRKKKTFEKLPKTDFFVGCVVSPFKRTEAELMTQFFKLEKKVSAGADFIIPQLGYDIRKFAEILKYMKYRNINLPILGNVYVLNRAVARVMNKGHIPGCVVTDELLKRIEEEAKAPDKGKRARLERAAQLAAIFRGLRFNGIHVGGFNLKFEDFEYIIKRSEEIAKDWRVYIPEFCYSSKDEYYYFPVDPELTFASDKLVPVKLPKKTVRSFDLKMGRLFHRLVFTEGALGYRAATRFWQYRKRRKSEEVRSYFFEKLIKRLLYDCQECGDCAIFDLAYLCPMSNCAKFQRNGPCGGSRNGICEADEEKNCVWTLVYDRLSSIDSLDDLRKEYVPPVNWSLSDTSSWANFFLGRDHTSKKLEAMAKAEVEAEIKKEEMDEILANEELKVMAKTIVKMAMEAEVVTEAEIRKEEINKILVADNDPAFVNSVRNVFENKSFRVATTDSMRGALEKVGRERPDVIILGTLTPRGSAFELHNRLKGESEYRDISILVLDIFPQNRLQKGWSIQEGLMLETEDYISQTVEPEFLLERVESLQRC